MTDHAAKRPFPLTKEPTHPWLGVHTPDPTRVGATPNSTVFGEPLSGAQSNFADGGLVGDAVTPLPSPGSALQPQQLLANGGIVGDVLGAPSGPSQKRLLKKKKRPAGNLDITSPVLGAPSGPLHSKLLKGLADGGEVEKDKDTVKPEDLGSGLLADAATDLTGRELQVENQIRAAQGLPPLKTKQ